MTPEVLKLPPLRAVGLIIFVREELSLLSCAGRPVFHVSLAHV